MTWASRNCTAPKVEAEVQTYATAWPSSLNAESAMYTGHMEAAPCAIILGIGVALIVIAAITRSLIRAARAHAIYAKYGQTETAERIIKRQVWVGQSTEQLRDSLGSPVDVDEKVLKTKTKHVWKYVHRGGNRFGLRITLENGFVVGWDERL